MNNLEQRLNDLISSIDNSILSIEREIMVRAQKEFEKRIMNAGSLHTAILLYTGSDPQKCLTLLKHLRTLVMASESSNETREAMDALYLGLPCGARNIIHDHINSVARR